MLLFLRHVLDTAGDYQEALSMAVEEHLMSGGIITVIGTRNHERAIVERTPTRNKVRSARSDEPLMATNHFRALCKSESCERYAFMSQKAETYPPLEILTNRQVLQEIIAQHVVMCPATQLAENVRSEPSSPGGCRGTGDDRGSLSAHRLRSVRSFAVRGRHRDWFRDACSAQ